MPGGANTGEAKITQAYGLPAKFVIHTVGPVWCGGGHDEEKRLESCYENAFRLAAENNIRSIAFPAISCDAYRFPIEKAARIAINAIQENILKYPELEKIVLVDINDTILNEYKKLLRI